MSYVPGVNSYCLATSGDNPTTTWRTCGAIVSEVDGVRTFRAVLTAPAGFTGEVRLFDASAGPPAAVAGSTLSTANAYPTALSAAVTLIADHLYYVQVRVASGSPTATDIAHLDQAEII